MFSCVPATAGIWWSRYAVLYLELCQRDHRLTKGKTYYKHLKSIGVHVLDEDGNMATFVPGSHPRVPQPYVADGHACVARTPDSCGSNVTWCV